MMMMIAVMTWLRRDQPIITCCSHNVIGDYGHHDGDLDDVTVSQ